MKHKIGEGMFIRQDAKLEGLGASIQKELTAALQGPDTLGEFMLLVAETTLNPQIKHNSETNPKFYLQFLEALQGSELVQNPTFGNMMYGQALNYVDRIEYAGHAMIAEVAVGLEGWEVMDVRPVFNIICYEETECPTPTLAFRVMVTREGQFKFSAINLEMIQQTGMTYKDLQPRKTPKKTKEVKEAKIAKSAKSVKPVKAVKAKRALTNGGRA